MRKCRRLVDILCNYRLITLAGTSIHKAWGSDNDSCPQEMSYGRYLRNKLQTQPKFRKPTAKGKFSSHPLRRRRKIRTDTPKPPLSNKCSASLKAVGMPIKRRTHNGQSHKSTGNTYRRVSGGKRIPQGCWWQYTLAGASRMDSLRMPGKLGSQAKSSIWHSCTLSCILRTPSIKKHMHPNKPPALLPSY